MRPLATITVATRSCFRCRWWCSSVRKRWLAVWSSTECGSLNSQATTTSRDTGTSWLSVPAPSPTSTGTSSSRRRFEGLLTAPELNANRKSYRTSQTLGQAGHLPAVSPTSTSKRRSVSQACLQRMIPAELNCTLIGSHVPPVKRYYKLTIIPKLRSTYDGRLIYETSIVICSLGFKLHASLVYDISKINLDKLTIVVSATILTISATVDILPTTTDNLSH